MNSLVRNLKQGLLTLVSFSLVSLAYAGPSDGNCASKAVTVFEGDSKSVTLVNEWDEDYKRYTDHGCYWYQLRILHGADYTVTITDSSSQNLIVTMNPWDYEGPFVVSDYSYENGDFYFLAYGSEWTSSDPIYKDYNIYIKGAIGDRVKLTVTKSILPLPSGTMENPFSFNAPSSTVQSRTVTPVDVLAYGWIHLQGGVRYRFETTGAKSDDGAAIGFNDCEINEVGAEGAFDRAYEVIAPEEDDYQVFLMHSSSAVWNKRPFSFRYFKDSSRPIGEHEIEADLTVGVARPFTPGRMIKAGSPYDDEVIDECLFRVAVESGHRYVLETEGASAPLIAMAYDNKGTIVARENVADGKNAHLLFLTAASGTWYVGVCENAATPSQKEIKVKVSDVTDLISLVTFDPTPGTLAESQRIREVVRGCPLGELPVPSIVGDDTAYAGVWLDDRNKEYTADSVVDVSSLVLHPKWTSKLSAAMDSNLTFANNPSNPNIAWFITEEDGYQSSSCVSSYGKLKKAHGATTLETSFSGSGVLTFAYRFVNSGSADPFTVTIDGKAYALATAGGSWQTCNYEIAGDTKHTVVWSFMHNSSSASDIHRVLLDQVRFNPAAAKFTISWSAGVTSACYQIGDGDFVPASNGEPFDVVGGARVRVAAMSADWWALATDLSQPFDPKVTSEVEISAKEVTAVSVVKDQIKPSDLGIVSGTFSVEAPGSATLAKVVGWARAQGVSVSAVNAMTFTKDPVANLEAAFLLNCAENEVAAESAKFVISSLTFVNGRWETEPKDGEDYGNGHVEIRSSLTPAGEFTVDEKFGDALFYRAYLVK